MAQGISTSSHAKLVLSHSHIQGYIYTPHLAQAWATAIYLPGFQTVGRQFHTQMHAWMNISAHWHSKLELSERFVPLPRGNLVGLVTPVQEDCHQPSGKALQQWRLAHGMDQPKENCPNELQRYIYMVIRSQSILYSSPPSSSVNTNCSSRHYFFCLSESCLQYWRWVEPGTV